MPKELETTCKGSVQPGERTLLRRCMNTVSGVLVRNIDDRDVE